MLQIMEIFLACEINTLTFNSDQVLFEERNTGVHCLTVWTFGATPAWEGNMSKHQSRRGRWDRPSNAPHTCNVALGTHQWTGGVVERIWPLRSGGAGEKSEQVKGGAVGEEESRGVDGALGTSSEGSHQG